MVVLAAVAAVLFFLRRRRRAPKPAELDTNYAEPSKFPGTIRNEETGELVGDEGRSHEMNAGVHVRELETKVGRAELDGGMPTGEKQVYEKRADGGEKV